MVPVMLRVPVAMRDEVDQLALDEGYIIRDGEANRSEMLRLLVKFALQHMPHSQAHDERKEA